MTEGRPWIEYKVGSRFCDGRANSTSHPHIAVKVGANCELLVQIRAFIEWNAPKLNFHNGAPQALRPRDSSGFCCLG
jgi:hypothetical protein